MVIVICGEVVLPFLMFLFVIIDKMNVIERDLILFVLDIIVNKLSNTYCLQEILFH